MATDPTILVAEGKYGTCHWRQYLVVTDARVAVVHMEPALFGGWRFQRVDIQDGEAWHGMTVADIVRYKSVPSCAPSLAPDLGEFKARLLAVATSGSLEPG